jgi:Ca2+-binding RTX toxin-like protein
MGSLRASLTSALLLLTVLPSAAQAASAPASDPTCASGPERVGDTIVGTPCADVIVAPPEVEVVKGGGGNDTIVGSHTTAASGSPETGLHLEVGSQTFEGGPGNDIVYGDRGNDTLRGNGGNDRLYGGIGDDVLEGGEGDDLLSGGFGADKIDGQAGNDYVRGDATIDHLFDTGGGFDTLSFATGVTPGFTANVGNPTGATGFPEEGGERGVWLKLGQPGVNAVDGEPSFGGGNDEVQPGVFERFIGTPFSDYIVGTAAAEEIWGGGGADVIEGGGGADALHGGTEGDLIEGSAEASIDGEGGNDNCVGGAIAANCEGTASAVTTRTTSKVSVGETTAAPGLTQVYLVGSTGADTVTATYGGGGNVEFTLSGASFDTSVTEPGRCTITSTTASCPVSGRLDAILLAGMGGNDSISANVPDGVGMIELGGSGGDVLDGTGSEDVLVDGEGGGADTLDAEAGDDALTHNGGPDLLDGGVGSDLFLSVSICDGETISGGAIGANDRDNASWARLGAIGAGARIDLSQVGEIGVDDEPACPAGRSFDALSGIEDLEGSNQSDVLYGDEGANQLLGHKGEDTYHARGGNDNLLANSGSRDRVIDCGPGLDQAIVDFASIADPTPIECERVREGAAEEFKELELLSEPPPPLPPPPPPDRTPPQTRITAHPPKLVWTRGSRRRVVFHFTSSEAGSAFRCRLDRAPFRPCRSPRAYRLRRGRHAFRVFAVDPAGNRDRSPALFRFRIRRR